MELFVSLLMKKKLWILALKGYLTADEEGDYSIDLPTHVFRSYRI